MAASRLGRAFGALGVAVGALALGASVALAADAPFPDRSPDRPVVDRADVLDRVAIEELTAAVEGLRDTYDVDAVVYLQIKPDIDSFETAVEDARSLMDAWSVGAGAALDGLVILGDLDESRCHGQLVLFADHELQRRLPDDIRQQIFDDELVPLLEECDIYGALSTAMAAIDGYLAGVPAEEPEPGSDDEIPIFTAEPWPGDPGYPVAPVVSPPSGVDGSTAFVIGVLAIIAVGAVLTAVRGGGIGGRRSGGWSGWQPFGGHHRPGHRDDDPGWLSGSGGSGGGGGSDSGSGGSGRTGGGSSGSGGGAAGGGF